jgi:hypothetical protein|uniref:Uncharacterized protein n=1 Tax=viral metagenome TaxID=1070528 RepID=A0A6C0IRL0_9ZZZZ
MRNHFSLGDWDRRGNSHPFGNVPFVKPTNISSSHYTSSKKNLTVIKKDGENQTQIVENNCTNNKGISNVGGPGDKTQAISKNNTYLMSGVSGLSNKRRLLVSGSGVDKKHGSYNRYLARKVGWAINKQHNMTC